MIASDTELVEIIKNLPLTKVESYFFRMVAVKRRRSLDSAEGARLVGGRFNPPLAESRFGLRDGFGFLYTATNPIGCLFECKHVLRGSGEIQVLPVEPSLLVTFQVECDCVLDLRDSNVQGTLNVSADELSAFDNRFTYNRRGEPTDLQRLRTALYKSGRFAGLLAPSRYSDIVANDTFNSLLDQVKAEVRDVENALQSI